MAIFYAIGQFFIAVNGQILNNHLSHLVPLIDTDHRVVGKASKPVSVCMRTPPSNAKRLSVLPGGM